MSEVDVSAMGFDGLVAREWLATNGLGGFACSTVCGMNTRKYHGLLVAAMAPPVRRMVILSRLDEAVLIDGKPLDLATNEYPGVIHPQGYKLLRAFANKPFPRWAFQGDGFTLEKSLYLVPKENTVCISYTLLAGDHSVELELRPMLALRPIHELMYQWNGRLFPEDKGGNTHRVPATSRTPEVFFAHDGRFLAEPFWYLNTIYRREQERGYGGLEDLWNPGAVRWTLTPGRTVNFVCSTEPIEFDRIISQADRPSEVSRPAVINASPEDLDLAELVVATEPYVLSLPEEAAARKAVNVITQYPWSAPSGRFALIGFVGLYLIPGRYAEAKQLLETLASHLEGGLVPSEFPESGGPPVYHGADTSLWFLHAAHQYLRYTGDEETTRKLLEPIGRIVESYRFGTLLGIAIDHDGLLLSRSAGTPTSWMDAKVNDWVVTPRQGRTVELNALWYNALRVDAELSARFDQPARAVELTKLADGVKSAFNIRFWNDDLRSCFDAIEDHGPDPSVRPNQLLAISLPYPVLAAERHATVVETVRRELLIDKGLRTLSPHDPAYQGRYGGHVVSRDRAAHQGTAYPWLLGALATAMVRAAGTRNERVGRQVRQMLQPCLDFLKGDGLGNICELFDGDAPHRQGGAMAAGAAAGELLRAYVEDALGRVPAMGKANAPKPPEPANPTPVSAP